MSLQTAQGPSTVTHAPAVNPQRQHGPVWHSSSQQLPPGIFIYHATLTSATTKNNKHQQQPKQLQGEPRIQRLRSRFCLCAFVFHAAALRSSPGPPPHPRTHSSCFCVSKPDPALVDYSKWSQLKSIFNHPPLQRLLSPQRTWKDERQFDALIFRLMVNILERYVRGEGVFELLRFFFLFYFISLLVSLN